ncbi:MAG: membrane protein [Immundisolibacter sp.]
MSKVPEVTLLFWMVKIAATTLGETGGDALSMSLGLGYLTATAVFAVLFAAAVGVQVAARRFHPAPYWTALVASTTVGTTLADFATRSLGIGYLGGSLMLAALLVASLATWRRVLGTVAIGSVATPRTEAFYWLTIMFSQTLGTALGDWTADTAGLGYVGAMALFGGMLMLLAGAYRFTRLSHTALFWLAFVLTRPLGAVVGDFLDKPLADGGLGLDRFATSAVLLAFITVSLLTFRARPARVGH